MIKIAIFIVLFFGGCSFEAPVDVWRYDSSMAFESYKKDFLSGEIALAKDELKMASLHAKRGADFEMLGSIYLGKCALNISVGINDKCKEYQNIQEIIPNRKHLDAYFAFLQKDIKKEQLVYLPKQYQAIAKSMIDDDKNSALDELKNIKPITSKLIAASLVKKWIGKKELKSLIKEASFYGYKQSVVFLLNELKNNTKDKNEAKIIDKKIEALKSGGF